MASQDRISALVSSQVPQFIRDDHPVFVEFLEKYYEFLEQPGNAVYEIKKFEDNYDVDTARDNLLQYFKNKIIPSFPEQTELSTERIIKASREFYAKKGTPESFQFLFKVIYGQDLDVYFPKLQILKASDGKWSLPQAFRLTLSGANENIDLSRITKRKAYGSISRASCIVENAAKVIDKSTGREIVEIFISSINRLFVNGEYLEISYIDGNGVSQVFSEKIIGAISNITINPNRRGRKYNTGDPVVINGGLDLNSPTRQKAVATVGNVTTGSIDSVTVVKGGYGFRTSPNSLVDIITANGVGANVTATGLDAANGFYINYSTDSILYKKNVLLSAANFGFANATSSNVNNTLAQALTFQSLFLAPLSSMTVTSGGGFFEAAPTLDAISVYESDYSTDQGLITIAPGSFTNYINTAPSIQFVGGSFSTQDDYYRGFRLLVEKQFRTITAYNGTTKTATLNRAFEVNMTSSSLLTKTLYLDTRPVISGMGRLGYIKVLNGGTGYSSADNVWFIGTGTNAAATLSVTGGVITAVNLTDRGEGYPSPPTVTVVSSTGANAIFQAVMLNDGEEFNVVTTDIGQIKDFNISVRGSDYVSTPNVSLKIYDIVVDTPPEGQTLLENDVVYQGVDINSTTFRGTVDSYDQVNRIVRVFNYSGSPTVGQPLIATRATSTSNISTIITANTIGGKTYPYRYGDGRAKADAQFLNGLIKYNGFYLNTDGHLSSDKKLQNKDKYHNFSYELVSEVNYSKYSKTIADVAHPAGMQLIPIHVIKDTKIVPERFAINSHAMFTNSTTNVSAFSLDTGNRAFINNTTSLLANTNDLLVISPTPIERKQVKRILSVSASDPTLDFDFTGNSYSYYAGANNALLLTLESNTAFIGDGKFTSTNNSNVLVISGNTDIITPKLQSNDLVEFTIPEYTTNFISNSENFDNTAWVKSEVFTQNNFLQFSNDFGQWLAAGAAAPYITVTANAAIAPDGTLTASKLVEKSLGGSTTHYIYTVPPRQVIAGQKFTYSIYVKSGERDEIMFRLMASGGAITTTRYISVNLTSNTIFGSGGTLLSSSITPADNGYKRISFTAATDAAGYLQPAIFLMKSAVNTYVGDDTSGLYVWGAQLVVGSAPGNYTPSYMNNLIEYSEAFENARWTKSASIIQYNLLTYSEQFDNAAWSITGVTRSADVTTAPDGTVTADRITGSSGTNAVLFPLTGYTALAGNLTVSAYIKAGTADYAVLSLWSGSGTNGVNLWVNVQTGAVGSNSVTAGYTFVSGSSTDVGNGWYRVALTGTVPAGTVYFSLRLVDGNNAFNYTNTIGKTLFVWGAQLVQGSAPGDYTKTTSAILPIQYIAPDGTVTAERLTENVSTATNHYIRQTLTSVVGAVYYTYSLYAKADTRSQFRLVLSFDNTLYCSAYYDVSTGTISNVAASSGTPTTSITSVGNGWYRCSITGLSPTAVSVPTTGWTDVRLASSGTDSYAGNGTGGLYIWGAQLSSSASLLPYVKTDSMYFQPVLETAPNNTNTAMKLIATRTSSLHNAYTVTNNTIPGIPYTVSTYAKAGEMGILTMILANSNNLANSISVYADVSSNGYIISYSYGGGGVVTDTNIDPVGNGWFRISVSGTPDLVSNTMTTVLYITANSAALTYAGDANTGMYIWGTQLENTPHLHTYMKTTSGPAKSTVAVNNTLRLNVASVAGNAVTMNLHSSAFSSNTSNIRYMVYPTYEGVGYKIITTNAVP